MTLSLNASTEYVAYDDADPGSGTFLYDPAFFRPGILDDVEIGDRRGESNGLSNIGLAYADLGEWDRAGECFRRALEIDRALGDVRGEAAALGNLGLTYEALNDYATAAEIYRKQGSLTRQVPPTRR